MVKHYIIMSSSYTDGTRVALDITEGSLLNSKAIAEIIKEIKQSCGKDVPLSTHLIETESDSWESVTEYDPFFEDVAWMSQIIFFQRFGAHIFLWKNWSISRMLIISVSILSAYLKIKSMHLPMARSWTACIERSNEAVPNMSSRLNSVLTATSGAM